MSAAVQTVVACGGGFHNGSPGDIGPGHVAAAPLVPPLLVVVPLPPLLPLLLLVVVPPLDAPDEEAAPDEDEDEEEEVEDDFPEVPELEVELDDFPGDSGLTSSVTLPGLRGAAPVGAPASLCWVMMVVISRVHAIETIANATKARRFMKELQKKREEEEEGRVLTPKSRSATSGRGRNAKKDGLRRSLRNTEGQAGWPDCWGTSCLFEPFD